MLTVHIMALVVNRRAAVVIAWVIYGEAEPITMIRASDTVMEALCGIACQAGAYSRATRASRN